MLLILSLLSINLNCQHVITDATADSNKEYNEFYFGFGGGYGFGGRGLIGIDLTSFINNNIGVSIDFHSFRVKANNLPDDYDYSFMEFSPVIDKIRMTSAMFIYEYPIAMHCRVAVGAGPAIVTYTENKFTFNPVYGTVKNCWWSCPPKYLKETERTDPSIGFTIRSQLEFPFSRSVGMEFATFLNINKYRSFVGVELFFTLGLVNSNIRPKL